MILLSKPTKRGKPRSREVPDKLRKFDIAVKSHKPEGAERQADPGKHEYALYIALVITTLYSTDVLSMVNIRIIQGL